MKEISKPKPKLGSKEDTTILDKPKPKLTGAFNHFKNELKIVAEVSDQDILTPEKGELVFDDGRDIHDLTDHAVKHSNTLIKLNADNIEPWEFANRSSDVLFLDELNRDLDTAGGQKSPILVRKLEVARPSSTNPEVSITHEVIAGRRRWEAARRRKDKTLICIEKPLSNQEAALEQEMENRRKDPSNYDDARTYKRYLESGLYPSQQALCNHLGIEKVKLSQLMNYTKLPAEVESALSPMHNISLHTIRVLRSYSCHSNKSIKEKCCSYILKNAEKIREGQLTFKNIEAAFKRMETPKPKNDINRTVAYKGNKVCNIKRSHEGKVTISFDYKMLSEFQSEEVRKELDEVLRNMASDTEH